MTPTLEMHRTERRPPTPRTPSPRGPDTPAEHAKGKLRLEAARRAPPPPEEPEESRSREARLPALAPSAAQGQRVRVRIQADPQTPVLHIGREGVKAAQLHGF